MRIKSIAMQNFKGCKSAEYKFDGKNATINGANGAGKTTIFDAITWLLFGKDSLDNAKFEIRPLDKDGEQVHHIEISVVATFDMDGRETELKKKQVENWVKKRGSEHPVLQGNVNSFEIDGYPKSEKEFKEYINSIVSDDLFKMLTNPTYFPNMPWKDQRAVVMKLASKVSDVDLAKKLKKFEPLLDELGKAPSTDDIKAKYTKSINELKKKQTEIPVRIDEVSNSKVDIDVAELELLKNALNEQIADVKGKIADTSKLFEEKQKLADGIMELKFAESDLSRKANEENITKRREIEDKIAELKKEVGDLLIENDTDSLYINSSSHNCKTFEWQAENRREEWKRVNALEFDENKLICPYCKQTVTDEQKNALIAEFEEKKAKDLAFIESVAKDLISTIETQRKERENCQNRIDSRNKDIEIKNNAIADLEKKLSALPTSIDVTDTEEYKAIQKQVAEKEKAMLEMNNADDVRNALNNDLDNLQAQLIDCEKQIALSAKNVEIDERISELETELKEVGVKIASQEKILYLLDEFIKYKLNKISDSINAMFDGVDFKLFDVQLNGGVKEVCECTINGVPYASLNNGHRIIAGLQIIKALQKMYGVYLPIFIDNAESVNDFNIPDMDCQLIKLIVADNKDLEVEVAE